MDGIVLEGKTSIDESMISGEPIPVEKSVGDKVTGGTLNTTGSILMAAQHVGSDTVLARIVQMVGEAQRSRAPIQALTDFTSVTGGGVVGKLGDREVAVGKPGFFRERGLQSLEALEQQATPFESQGQNAMFVAINGQPPGVIVVSDPIKASTPVAIAQLHKRGLKIIMLTGDNERTARAVAQKLGIDAVEGSKATCGPSPRPSLSAGP